MPRASKRLARYREPRGTHCFVAEPGRDPADGPASLWCPTCGVLVPREEWCEVEWVGPGPPPTESCATGRTVWRVVRPGGGR